MQKLKGCRMRQPFNFTLNRNKLISLTLHLILYRKKFLIKFKK